MKIQSNLFWYLASVSLYILLSLQAWTRSYQILNLSKLTKQYYFNKISYQFLLSIALLSHGFLLYFTILSAGYMVFGFAHAISFMLWLALFMHWLESFFLQKIISEVKLFLFPSAALASLLPLAASGSKFLISSIYPWFAWFNLHFIISNIADGLLVMAAAEAVFILLLQKYLHNLNSVTARTTTSTVTESFLYKYLGSMPPLLTMESTLFAHIAMGFIFLTLAIASGVWFSTIQGMQFLVFNHKTIFAFIAWILLAVLLCGRYYYGLRGRRVLYLVLTAFLILFLAYIGTQFVLEVLLGKIKNSSNI